MPSRRSVCVLVCTGLLVTLAGCPPTGDSRGRVSIHETTPAEKKDPRINTSDLAAACDEVAQALAVDINRVVEEEFKGCRVALVRGEIDNQARGMPLGDFKYMQTRINNRLHGSKLFRDNVRVLDRLPPPPEEDILQRPDHIPASNSPNPEYLVFLNGEAHAVHRGGTHLYYVAFKLIRASDNEQLFVKDYEVKYGTGRDK